MESWVLNFNKKQVRNNFAKALAKMMHKKGDERYVLVDPEKR